MKSAIFITQYPVSNASLLSSLITAAEDVLTVLHMYTLNSYLLEICDVVIKNFFMWIFGFVIYELSTVYPSKMLHTHMKVRTVLHFNSGDHTGVDAYYNHVTCIVHTCIFCVSILQY